MFTPELKGKKVLIEVTVNDPEEFNKIIYKLHSREPLMGSTVEKIVWNDLSEEVLNSVKTMVNHLREIGIQI